MKKTLKKMHKVKIRSPAAQFTNLFFRTAATTTRKVNKNQFIAAIVGKSSCLQKSTTSKVSPSDFLKTSSPYFTPDRMEEGAYEVVNSFREVDTEKIKVPPYFDKESWDYSMKLEIHNDEQDVNSIRRVNKLAGEVLRYAGSLVKEGVTTEEIDEKVFNYIVSI